MGYSSLRSKLSLPGVGANRRLFPEKSNYGVRRHKIRRRRQQFLNLRVDPQGQGSLRPSFSNSSLSTCTTRIPRLTCVSEGKPLRRLLLGVKGLVGVDVELHKKLQT